MISPFVIAKIGETHARALFPGGRRFDAIRAQRIGLVHEVVEGDDGARCGGRPAVARRPGVRPHGGPRGEGDRPRGARAGHGSAKWHTARVIARQRVSEEAQEGFRAFVEKRRPGWAPEGVRLTHPGAGLAESAGNATLATAMTEELAPSEVAKRLGTSTRTVQRWIERGVLPARRVGALAMAGPRQPSAPVEGGQTILRHRQGALAAEALPSPPQVRRRVEARRIPEQVAGATGTAATGYSPTRPLTCSKATQRWK